MTASGSLPGRSARGCDSRSRPGNDLTRQFPLIVEALARLRSRSCIIDGAAVDGAGAFWSPEGTKVPSGVY